jgi:hypothetical protein
VAALVAGVLFWIVGRQKWPRTTVFLILGGAGGLVATQLGQWVHQAISYVYEQIGAVTGPLFGFGVAVIAGVSALALAIMVAFHVHHRAVGDKTLLATAAIPWAVPFVPGALGTILGYVVSFATGAIGALGYLAFNGHL